MDTESIDELKKHKIGILGFGQEGQAVLKYLFKHNLTATVFDHDEILPPNQDIYTKSKFITGQNYLDSISEYTLLFRSPGIWRQHPKILEAEQAGVIITSQTKWFFEHTEAKIIGVTGTKGKGTTCSLIFEVLKDAGKIPNQEIYLTGNIGRIQPLDFIDELNTSSTVIYELSSFQLQDLTLSPHIGVCLMVTSDHLNHHKDLHEYHEAKSAISNFQTSGDYTIYNSDYEASEKIGNLGHGKKLTVSTKLQTLEGAFISGDKIKIQGAEIDCTLRKLRGTHNLENIAAAALVGLTLGIDLSTISEAVNNFTGLEHRLQLVAELNGVKFYNDSISTVPETTIAALNSFTEPVHLLLGGSEKGLDYSAMASNILKRTNISSISLIGKVGENLHHLFKDAPNSMQILGPYSDFKFAVNKLKELAAPGDIVLLSPAAASFDMFKNYADRGNQCVQRVNN